MKISPFEGSRLTRARSSVLLPAPLGPVSSARSPASRLKSAWLMIGVPPSLTVTSSATRGLVVDDIGLQPTRKPRRRVVACPHGNRHPGILRLDRGTGARVRGG